LYTENKNREELEKFVSEYFDSFTVFMAVGWWKGDKEYSLVFEILVNHPIDVEKVRALGDMIRTFNKQQAVLLTVKEVVETIIH